MSTIQAFVSTTTGGDDTGHHRETINRLCKRYPGFGFRVSESGHWRIPAKHIALLKAGVPAEKIAADARAAALGEHSAA